MNFNLVLAVLEYKEIISAEEAEKLADNLASGIQSTNYKDAQLAVKKLLATE